MDDKSLQFQRYFPSTSEQFLLRTEDKKDISERGDVSFKKILTDLIDKVNQLQKDADESIQKLVTGQIDSVHQVMIAVEEANIAFRLMMEIRNKLIEAYQQIIRMQI